MSGEPPAVARRPEELPINSWSDFVPLYKEKSIAKNCEEISVGNAGHLAV
jgi:hypothetical protein